jgi:hypothetical protein
MSGLFVGRCRTYRAFGRSHSADELLESTMIFQPWRGFYSATNVDCVGCHRRDRATNILCVQTAGENQESRVAFRGPRSGPIARQTGTAFKLRMIRIDEHITVWKSFYAFRHESRID